MLEAIGRLAWVEGRLFEILAAWVPATGDLELKLLFAAEARHHGWRCRMLAGLLPGTRSRVRELVRARDLPWAGALDELDALAGDEERLDALRAVLPRILAATGYPPDSYPPDGPTSSGRISDPSAGDAARVLDLVHHDTAEDQRRLEEALRRRSADRA